MINVYFSKNFFINSSKMILGNLQQKVVCYLINVKSDFNLEIASLKGSF